jgi:hypothetical protein
MLGRGPVGEAKPGAAALEEGLGDEETEAESAGLRMLHRAALPPRGDIRLADAVDDLGREAGAVVDDLDDNAVVRPRRPDLDLAAREIDSVFDEIAEAV